MPSPSTLPGLYSWHKADAITGFSDGASVNSWADSSGNGWTLTNGSTNLPTYTASVTALASKPALAFFTGTTAQARLGSSTAQGSQATQTLTAVFVPTAFTSSQTMVAGGQASGGLAIYYTSGRAIQVVRTGTAVMVTSATLLTAGQPYVVTVDFDNTGSINLYINGTRDTGSAVNHNYPALSGTGFHVGANSGNGEPFYGYLAEVVHCTTVLGAKARAGLHSYVSDKYGITVSDYTTATVPANPTALTATPTAGQVALSWTASATAGATYNVYRRTTLVGQASGTSFTEKGVTASGVKLDYYVTAVSGGVESDQAATTATTPLALKSGAPKVIFDTDIAGDADDLGALAVLHKLADAGECEIIGMGNDAGSGANAMVLSAMNTYYGRPAIPLANKSGANATTIGGTYAGALVAEFPHPLKTAAGLPTAATLYRQLLAAAADASVILICVGFLDNVSALLQSAADGTSSLTGVQLVAAKVKTLVVMGGQYPSGTEYNFAQSPAAAQYVVANWPTQMTFTGYEVGVGIKTGGSLSTATPATNPVRRGYQLYRGAGVDTDSWDQTAVYHALRPSDALFGKVTTGSNSVNATTGANTWSATPDPTGTLEQTYLTLPSASAAKAAIDALMVASPTPTTLPKPPAFPRYVNKAGTATAVTRYVNKGGTAVAIG